MSAVSPPAAIRLEHEQLIWLASTRPDGRPHLVPLWFVWVGERIYLCIQPSSVKARNILQNPHVVLALESASAPLVVEGRAIPLSRPWPAAVVDAFRLRYQWEIESDSEYGMLLEIEPYKWLAWVT